MAIALYCPLEKYILMSGYEEINGRLTTNPDYTLAVNKAREVCWSKICKNCILLICSLFCVMESSELI